MPRIWRQLKQRTDSRAKRRSRRSFMSTSRIPEFQFRYRPGRCSWNDGRRTDLRVAHSHSKASYAIDWDNFDENVTLSSLALRSAVRLRRPMASRPKLFRRIRKLTLSSRAENLLSRHLRVDPPNWTAFWRTITNQKFRQIWTASRMLMKTHAKIHRNASKRHRPQPSKTIRALNLLSTMY